ncbi:penicillin acylase family protein [Allosphingosinicella deserti]|uniref:Acylase n=1 Tax=Allosphingosinicella deserti TaxID=2116704 RepID=A0A2P7QS98_9SPHN|nr:penicillin acylase family protein [Sphingomonas deserti]PSJ40829.1 acylase [Sphingomonas deserti]
MPLAATGLPPAFASGALLLLLSACATPQTIASSAASSDAPRWRAAAQRVEIIRDDWGIAHITGKTDADTVFGMIYAQAEDDFNRIETNYLVALGRLAEAEGEGAIWQDLRARLYMDPADLQVRWNIAPDWLKQLTRAWADGLNFYLASHPEVRPRAITRFEPWMALSFTEGSIGGDIERIDLTALEAFYGGRPPALAAAVRANGTQDREPRGSNGFAIAPSNTENGHALLLINPHTSFFFRAEQQVTSGEGLNAYGAATWGQFFIYQGFNAHAGWMHTSSGVDAVDEFLETIEQRPDGLRYRYGTKSKPVAMVPVTLRYRTVDGSITSRRFETYRTEHGPIVREQDGKWVAFAMMHKPVAALEQSYLRTKAKDYASFLEVAKRKANSSNNTIYADSKGAIAYLHPQFIPVRDVRFDYSKPVDGSDPRTNWRGLHKLDEAPHLLNPANGWIQNTNNWPYSSAGPNSPRPEDFPAYMDEFGENARGVHAVKLLGARKDFTLDRLRDAAFDRWQPGFATLVPTLVAAFDALPPSARKSRLAEPIAMLRAWDHRWAAESVPTALAIFWADRLMQDLAPEVRARRNQLPASLAERTSAAQKLAALEEALARLQREFGRWQTPWGEINRFQRLTGDIVQPFTDAGPSIAVPFPSAIWGSLASFGAKPYPGTKRWYGTSGNSFVAMVEFGPRIRARAVSAGGESGDPKSPHFNDQAQRYADGNFRTVYFHPDELAGHVARRYRPGE